MNTLNTPRLDTKHVHVQPCGLADQTAIEIRPMLHASEFMNGQSRSDELLTTLNDAFRNTLEVEGSGAFIDVIHGYTAENPPQIHIQTRTSRMDQLCQIVKNNKCLIATGIGGLGGIGGLVYALFPQLSSR